VGLLDADVYGPSIPHLTGVSGQPAIKEFQSEDGRTIERMETHESDGVKIMSMGFMVAPEQAVIWRGPMLHKALTQMLGQTDWGELDYLIIDMPPGTGDVPLSLSQSVGMSGAVVVCTPQQVALLDAVKAVAMFRQVKIPVLGMVENMSGDLFGRGGTKAKALELGVPFLGEVPAVAGIRERGDTGRISSLLNEEGPVRDALLHVSHRTAIEAARQLLEQSAMPQLEIL
jgi:ATP-binding protein involved in chromosome partitioning